MVSPQLLRLAALIGLVGCILLPIYAGPLNSARVCWIKHVDTPLTSRRAVTGVTPLPVARTGDYNNT
jgi:hypothetical protein